MGPMPRGPWRFPSPGTGAGPTTRRAGAAVAWYQILLAMINDNLVSCVYIYIHIASLLYIYIYLFISSFTHVDILIMFYAISDADLN